MKQKVIKSSLEEEKHIRRAVRPYKAPILFFYDVGVYKIWNPFIWKCPSLQLEEHFKQYIRSPHLEAGCGTGYLFHRYMTSEKQAIEHVKEQFHLTLLDYSPGSLNWAARRLKDYTPCTIRHNLMLPLPPVSRPYESICLNYVLHCVPGNFTEKEKVIVNLKESMAPGGILFGSTILSESSATGYSAKLVLVFYNLLGSFHNLQDTEEGLIEVLSKNFHYIDCHVIGSVALFAASDRKLQRKTST
jgi:SAM-dependent methyltransferase